MALAPPPDQGPSDPEDGTHQPAAEPLEEAGGKPSESEDSTPQPAAEPPEEAGGVPSESEDGTPQPTEEAGEEAGGKPSEPEDSTPKPTEEAGEEAGGKPSEPEDGTLQPADEPPEEAGGKMSFLDHLDELRKRLISSSVALIAGVLICFGFIPFIFEFIMEPLTEVLPEGDTLVFTEPMEAFFLNIKMAALAGLLVATPFILWQVWLFVAPGLYVHEKKFAIPFVGLASFFFIGGTLFSHYVLFPLAWNFFASFDREFLTFMPRIQPAFSLYVRLSLACGVVFQLPTIVFFLARVGLATPGLLIRNTKYAILGIFIFAAVLTPTGDPVVLTMMAAPMIALYGLSIVIAWAFGRRDADK